MGNKGHSVKCWLRNHFDPDYQDYSSYDEVVLLVKQPDFQISERPMNKEKWQSYLAEFVEDSYLNADGIFLQTKLCHLVDV
ncbi:hypothetical protein FMV2238Y02_19980 [Streptococcus canis]|uniref:Uncharacterized protein n=1 Tax=Streptococcus canis TaxID=1329 RepID=A0A3P5YBZ5_STRCB|nr:hypothetical protein [Streptococcus canis]MDV5972259.1 hypothetical protein [Streptococcus canis]QKG78285.1 hypothetical protein GE021_009355 [Streptococcus canis]VDC43494.1 hypothetical protein FMV2238Y02_19980 [Streptococcus canis]